MNHDNKRKLDDKTWQIINAFQQFTKDGNKSHIHNYKIEDLKFSDISLGDRDKSTPYRRAIKDRILELEKADAQKSQRNQHCRTIAIAIIAILVAILLWYFT